MPLGRPPYEVAPSVPTAVRAAALVGAAARAAAGDGGAEARNQGRRVDSRRGAFRRPEVAYGERGRSSRSRTSISFLTSAFGSDRSTGK